MVRGQHDPRASPCFRYPCQRPDRSVPGLYSGHYIKDLLGTNSDPVLANCWFWLSQYGPTAVVPANWPTWTMWQYTDGAVGPQPHSVPGAGMCDRDKFNRDQAGLPTRWGAA